MADVAEVLMLRAAFVTVRMPVPLLFLKPIAVMHARVVRTVPTFKQNAVMVIGSGDGVLAINGPASHAGTTASGPN